MPAAIKGTSSSSLLDRIKVNPLSLSVHLLFGFVFMNINAFLAMIFGVKSLITFALLGLSLFIIYKLWNRKGYNIRFWIFQLALLFFLYFLYIGTMVFLADPSDLHPYTSLVSIYRNYLSSLLIIPAFYFGAQYILKKKGLTYLVKLLFAFFIFSSFITVIGPLIGITDIYKNINYNISVGDRDSGLFGNPNEAGVLANYTLIIVLSCYLYFKKRKWIWLLLATLPMYSAFVTFSKSAIIETGVILVFFTIFNLFYISKIGKVNRRYLFVFVSFIVVSIFAIIIQFNLIYESLSKNQKNRIDAIMAISQGQINKKTTSERSVIFSYAFDKISNSPLVGHGIGSFHRFNGNEIQIGTHNTYLLIQGESGIGGMILFLSVYLSILVLSFKIKHPAIRFMVIGVSMVFLTNKATFGHTALKDRTSNGLLGISLALLALTVSKKEIYLNDKVYTKISS